MAELSLQDVKKNYGSLEVIHGISIDIREGEFIVIVGPSGCGKSTLLRMVAGLEEITSGTIAIGGKIVNDKEPKDRNIAMVFQNYALYPHMSVFNNMAYGLKIAGLVKDEIKKRVEKAASLLQLEPYLERKPRALSGGQRQRVAMGRALVRDPAVFLFDEPLSNLDAKLRVQMRLEIKKMQQSLGKTSLYVTHDQVEAMTLADRLIVMNGGIADQIDTPLKVYEKPATIFVAGFIGSPAMNIMEASIEMGKLRLKNNIEVSDLPLPARNGLVLFGIRAEHFILCERDRADFALTVQAIETLGADTLLHGYIQSSYSSSQKEGDMNQFIVRIPGSLRVGIGERVPLQINREFCHFFDKQTEQRIEV